MFRWSDIRTFLAVLDGGSAAAAARALGTNQTTVSRRIGRLEAALGLRLFEPGARGAAPTANARALEADARAMEAAAGTLGRRAEGMRRTLSGTIRITTVPGVARHLSGLLRAFQAAHPGVRFDLGTEDAVLSLEDGEADVAIRSSDGLEGDALIARKLIDHPWGFYASRDWVARHGAPRDPAALAGRHVVLYGPEVEAKVAAVRRGQAGLAEGCGHFRVASIEVMLGLLLAGEGPGLLPRATGDLEPGLELCLAPPELHQRLWIVWTREAEARPHVGAFLAFMRGALGDLIAGLPPDWSV